MKKFLNALAQSRTVQIFLGMLVVYDVIGDVAYLLALSIESQTYHEFGLSNTCTGQLCISFVFPHNCSHTNNFENLNKAVFPPANIAKHTMGFVSYNPQGMDSSFVPCSLDWDVADQHKCRQPGTGDFINHCGTCNTWFKVNTLSGAGESFTDTTNEQQEFAVAQFPYAEFERVFQIEPNNIELIQLPDRFDQDIDDTMICLFADRVKRFLIII